MPRPVPSACQNGPEPVDIELYQDDEQTGSCQERSRLTRCVKRPSKRRVRAELARWMLADVTRAGDSTKEAPAHVDDVVRLTGSRLYQLVGFRLTSLPFTIHTLRPSLSVATCTGLLEFGSAHQMRFMPNTFIRYIFMAMPLA
jgi:hypothetical protein